MPEFTVKELHLPELHLPEIKRDEIVRSLAGVRLPEIDMSRAKGALTRVPSVTLTSADVGKVVAIGAAVARSVRPAPSRSGWLPNPFRRRSRSPIARLVKPRPSPLRRPIAVGAVAVAGLGAWALLRRPEVRERLDALMRRARERFDEWRSTVQELRATAPSDTDAVAFSAAETAPIVADGFASAIDDAGSETTGSDYPDGLGLSAVDADHVPALEETASRS